LDKELIDAIKIEDTKTALYCLNAGADPNTRDPDEEANAHIHGFDDILEWLKQFTEKRTPRFHNPAIIALFVDQVYPDHPPQENLEIARALLDHGADINARDEEGVTPLIWALNRKWNRTAHLLLERGADIHLRTREGFTPLMAARGEQAEQLIRRGADVHAVDSFGTTALHYACEGVDLAASGL
jgi:hypothetical protein